MSPRLYLCANNSRLMLLRIETMLVYAARYFPAWSAEQRKRWVQAKIYVDGRKPSVEIGIRRVDTSRCARSLREIR